MKKYFLIHGSYGHPYKNWFPWLYAQLAKRGEKCIVPQFPTPDGQNFEAWERFFQFYIDEGYVDANTTVITHSISCVFAVKFCVKHDFNISRFVSVAGFNNINFDDNESLKDIYKSFYDDPQTLAKFKDLCPERVSFYSDDDPYVPMVKGKEFADIIDAKHVFVQGGGHLNGDSGYREFKDILEYII